MEDRPDLGMVVEGDHPFSSEGCEALPEAMDVVDLPGAVKGDGAVGVWRIQEEECGRPIPEGNAVLPVEVLDGDTVEANVELSDGIEPGGSGSRCSCAGAGGRDAECAEISTSEAVPVAKKPPGGSLDVCEAGLVSEIFELLAGVEDELQLGEQRIRMKAHAAVECNQVTVEVIEDFDFRARLGEQDGQSACEWLDVAFMLGNEWQDMAKEAGLSSRPGDGRPEWRSSQSWVCDGRS